MCFKFARWKGMNQRMIHSIPWPNQTTDFFSGLNGPFHSILNSFLSAQPNRPLVYVSKMKHWELKKFSWIVGCVHQHVVVYMLNGRSDIFFEFIDRNAIMAGQTSSSSSLAEMQLNLQPWC